MTAPYYSDDVVTLYHGDCRELLPALALTPDCTIADPPYAETSLAWDRWPDGWPPLIPGRSLWCFGSMRMFLDRRDEFTGWRFAQDIVWEKHNGSSLASDRFRRVHEHAVHRYRAAWAEQHRDVPVTHDATPRAIRRKPNPAQWQGARGASVYTSEDGGPRLQRSVLHVRSMHGTALHPTEKPFGVLAPLITYSTPVGGLVLDPFAGSGSALAAAKADGRRAVGIEADERYCEVAARRLAQNTLDFSEVAG